MDFFDVYSYNIMYGEDNDQFISESTKRDIYLATDFFADFIFKCLIYYWNNVLVFNSFIIIIICKFILTKFNNMTMELKNMRLFFEHYKQSNYNDANNQDVHSEKNSFDHENIESKQLEQSFNSDHSEQSQHSERYRCCTTNSGRNSKSKTNHITDSNIKVNSEEHKHLHHHTKNTSNNKIKTNNKGRRSYSHVLAYLSNSDDDEISDDEIISDNKIDSESELDLYKVKKHCCHSEEKSIDSTESAETTESLESTESIKSAEPVTTVENSVFEKVKNTEFGDLSGDDKSISPKVSLMTVYINKNGKCFHTNLNCTHLNKDNKTTTKIDSKFAKQLMCKSCQ